MLPLLQNGDDVVLAVFVQPRASRNAVAGIQQGALKILLTAPPVEGAANQACIRFLAVLLGFSASRLSIVKGAKARHKLIRIRNTSLEELRARLKGILTDL